jgi:pSer/pThr/pTyr-binding forkhead associated (FHA) protein
MRAQVLCRTRPGQTESFELPEGSADMGRDPAAAVSLQLEGVSRRHARITWDGKHHWLEDLKSTNGTFLNGQSVQRDRLRHLDVITLGKKVDLLFLRRGEDHVTRKQGIVKAALVGDAAELARIEIPLGELSLGRAPACNVIIEKSAVSKMHARIERTPQRLVVQDLESANGTFVNGTRVTSAVLRDGDVLSLAGAESFRVAVEIGEVVDTVDMVVSAAPAPAGAAAKAPGAPAQEKHFSNEWKTRFEWSSGERAAIADLQMKLAEEDRVKREKPKPTEKGAAKPAPKAGATARPAAPSPKPAAPAKQPAPPKDASPPAAAPLASPPPAAPAVAPAAAPPAQRAPPSAGRVLEVRLTGAGFDVAATAPGHYTLGRSAEAALRVNHATVSRQHARISITEDRAAALVQDLGGANGTLLNGAAIKQAEPLTDGDVVQLGDLALKVAIRRE